VRDEMRKVLSEIQDGSFARRWIAEGAAGAPEFRRMRAEAATAPIEAVGGELRAAMSFISPKQPPAGWSGASAQGSQPAEPAKAAAEVGA
jgi:ketol-acid reductoisomerase